jgi:hypothetical protein
MNQQMAKRHTARRWTHSGGHLPRAAELWPGSSHRGKLQRDQPAGWPQSIERKWKSRPRDFGVLAETY